MGLRGKLASAVDIAPYYLRRPDRLSEVVNWAKQRNTSPLDLRLPWWNYEAIKAVREALPLHANVFEYGGGGSTLWLYDLGARLTTVEHDEQWMNALRTSLPSDCTVLYRPPENQGTVNSESEMSAPDVYYDSYVRSVHERTNTEPLDLVIVDGRARIACLNAASREIADGGLLVLDDSDRHRYQVDSLLPGWERSDFRGAKPGGGGLAQTSMWRKP